MQSIMAFGSPTLPPLGIYFQELSVSITTWRGCVDNSCPIGIFLFIWHNLVVGRTRHGRTIPAVAACGCGLVVRRPLQLRHEGAASRSISWVLCVVSDEQKVVHTPLSQAPNIVVCYLRDDSIRGFRRRFVAADTIQI